MTGSNQSLAQKRAEVKKLEDKLNGVSREIEGSSSEMEKYGTKVKAKEADLANRIRAMYKTERAGGNRGCCWCPGTTAHSSGGTNTCP